MILSIVSTNDNSKSFTQDQLQNNSDTFIKINFENRPRIIQIRQFRHLVFKRFNIVNYTITDMSDMHPTPCYGVLGASMGWLGHE